MSRFTANRPSCWGVYSDAASFLRTMLFVGMALFSGMTLADDFTDAVRSFKNRQYQQALSLFEQGAKKEDPVPNMRWDSFTKTVLSSKKIPDWALN